MIEPGAIAPDFTLLDQRGEPLTLSALRGSAVLLYFYPKDDTPGCTTQACGFRDAAGPYEVVGARVVGISPDDPASHARFAAKFGLAFPLVADPGGVVAAAYGVWKEKNLYGHKKMGVERTTFLIDAGGTVRRVFRRVKVEGHALAMLEELADLDRPAT